MSIHEAIAKARQAKGWSMEQLAGEISKAEGLKKPLAWQTVQQWENGKSAPKRKRLAIVQQVLGVDLGAIAVPPGSGQTSTTGEEPPTYRLNAEAYAALTSPVLRSLINFGAVMQKQDVATRDATASLMVHLCRHPEDAETIAQRIVALISVTGNTGAQRFINSPTSKAA